MSSNLSNTTGTSSPSTSSTAWVVPWPWPWTCLIPYGKIRPIISGKRTNLYVFVESSLIISTIKLPSGHCLRWSESPSNFTQGSLQDKPNKHYNGQPSTWRAQWHPWPGPTVSGMYTILANSTDTYTLMISPVHRWQDSSCFEGAINVFIFHFTVGP